MTVCRPELLVKQRSAMQSGTGGDVVFNVQPLSYLAGFHAFDIDSESGEMILQAVATIETNSLDPAKSLDQLLGQAHLPGVYVLDTALRKPVLPGPQGRDPDQVGRTELHSPGDRKSTRLNSSHRC